MKAMSTAARQAELVAAALNDPRWDFRTIDGIAAETRLPPEVVQRVIADNPAFARKSVATDEEGRELYTARRRSVSLRERLEQLRWVLAR